MAKLTDLAAQKAIDDQIIHYISTIFALKRRRNTYCAIAHIPDSILSSIFMHLHGDHFICDNNESKMWHRVNLVCSHWRAVAVASPCLWSNIMVRTYDDPSHTANWMMEKMARAATVPLNVRYDIYCPSAQTVDPCSSVVTQAIPSRSLHDLSITSKAFNHTQNILDTILKSGTQASKSLRILSIHSPASQELRLPGLGDCKEMPNLQSLTFDRMSVPVTLPSFPRLTHLCCTSETSNVSVPWLLGVLSTTPMIEEVIIRKALINDENSLTHVSLPHLKRLSIAFPESSSLPDQLFGHLTFPLGTAIAVIFDLPCRGPWDMVDARDVMSRFAGWMNQMTYETLEINTTYVQLNITLRSTIPQQGPLTIYLLSPINLDLLHILPLDQFSSLVINTARYHTLYEMSWQFMITHLAKFVGVENLTIKMKEQNTLFINKLRVDRTGVLPNVGLKILQGTFGTEDLDALEGLVYERREYGAPLERVYFLDSIDVEDESLARLKDMVECVFSK